MHDPWLVHGCIFTRLQWMSSFIGNLDSIMRITVDINLHDLNFVRTSLDWTHEIPLVESLAFRESLSTACADLNQGLVSLIVKNCDEVTVHNLC